MSNITGHRIEEAQEEDIDNSLDDENHHQSFEDGELEEDLEYEENPDIDDVRN